MMQPGITHTISFTTPKQAALLAVAAMVFSLSLPASAQQAPARPAAKAAPAANVQAELDALIKAAKAEGEIVYYVAATENVAKRVTAAFSEKYGIKAPYVRLSSAALGQRYATEAESGNIAAELAFFAGNVAGFANDAIKKGWVQSISEAGIPALKSGEFPARFNKGPVAIVQIAPWGIGYRTDKLSGGDIPRDWPDLLQPRFKGQIVLANPSSSDAYVDLWATVLERHGEAFFTKLREQAPRQSGDGVQSLQAMAAGEGIAHPPTVPGQVQGLKDKGAPVDMTTPAYTTGVEMQVMLTAVAKSKHPNAARLLAHYVLSREGNKVFNDDPGGITMYDTAGLPKEYQNTKPENLARKATIIKLLGF